MTLEQAEKEYHALLTARIVRGEDVDVNRMRELQELITSMRRTLATLLDEDENGKTAS